MRRATGRFVAVGLIAALMSTGVAPSVSDAASAFPPVINLPNGFQPEGIAIGRGTSFYAGSLADGAIYRGDLRTGAGDVLVPGVPGRAIAGLFVDDRSNAVFAAGAFSGEAFVFDAATGATLATYQLGAPFVSFVNDVVVTREAAYFTDSFQTVLYRLPLGPTGALPDPSAVQRLTLSGEFVQVPGMFVFNSNGIEASSDGQMLLVVNSATGVLFRVDPLTGNAVEVDLGGVSLTAGDGLRLQGSTLYVVRNALNQIAVVQLAPLFSGGTLVTTVTDPGFDVPTTVGKFGSSLYVVNARFFTPPTPDTTYTVVEVSRLP